MNDTISVIVPHYCIPKELFLRCVKSILMCASSDIEVLVIDDGSPEEYKESLNLVSQDPRVRIINAPHAGVSAARNRGIEEAKGKWITFVDGDDYLNSNTFSFIIEHLDQFTGDIEIFNGGLDVDGRIWINTNVLQEGYDYGASESDKRAVMESALAVGKLPEGYRQTFSYGAPYCKLLKRELLISNHLRFNTSVTFAEDVLFMLEVYQYASSIYFHDQVLYYYVNNSASVTRKFRPGISKDMDVFFEATKKLLDRYGLFEDLEKAYYLRAQFEVRRSYDLEFFNPQNTDPDAKKHFKEFISKEPYRTAVKRRYLRQWSRPHQLKDYLIDHGMIRTLDVCKVFGALVRKIV